MCQHAADDGCATDWHLVHLGKFALGGAGLIFTESVAVSPHGRIGVRDLGLWRDDQIASLHRVVDFVHQQGAKIGVQLAHAGRKAGSQALWECGRAFGPDELKLADGSQWRRLGPSPIAAGPAWTAPEPLDAVEIAEVTGQFVAATRRAETAGFDAIELHFGHGYLVASFLSPLANQRDDAVWRLSFQSYAPGARHRLGGAGGVATGQAPVLPSVGGRWRRGRLEPRGFDRPCG